MHIDPNIERQLSELEARHAAHQAMLDEHRERKWQRRDNHRKGIHKFRCAPGALV